MLKTNNQPFNFQPQSTCVLHEAFTRNSKGWGCATGPIHLSESKKKTPRHFGWFPLINLPSFPGSQIQGGQPVIGSLSPKGADQGHVANVIRFNAGTSWRPLSPLMESSAAFSPQKNMFLKWLWWFKKARFLNWKVQEFGVSIVAKEAKKNRFCRGVPFSEMFEWHREAN